MDWSWLLGGRALTGSSEVTGSLLSKASEDCDLLLAFKGANRCARGFTRRLLNVLAENEYHGRKSLTLGAHHACCKVDISLEFASPRSDGSIVSERYARDKYSPAPTEDGELLGPI
jgi:hypothetical protein